MLVQLISSVYSVCLEGRETFLSPEDRANLEAAEKKLLGELFRTPSSAVPTEGDTSSSPDNPGGQRLEENERFSIELDQTSCFPVDEHPMGQASESAASAVWKELDVATQNVELILTKLKEQEHQIWALQKVHEAAREAKGAGVDDPPSLQRRRPVRQRQLAIREAPVAKI